jgi:tetratricopeptide (TPR) repeat protein
VKNYLLIVLSLFSIRVTCQSRKDSLLQALQKPSHDTTRANILYRLSNEVNEDSAISSYSRLALQLADTLCNSSNIEIRKVALKTKANSLHNIGFVQQNIGKVEKALAYMDQALGIWRELGNKWGIATTLNNIGYIYHQQGLMEKALDAYFESLKLREEIKDADGASFNLNNIGYIYYDMGDPDKALDYYQRALVIREKSGKEADLAGSLNNIGYIYQERSFKMKDPDSVRKQLQLAYSYYERAFKLRTGFGDKRGMANSFNSLGLIYQSMLRTTSNKDSIINYQKRSLTYYEQALKIREDLGDKKGISHSLMSLANYYLIQKKWKEAEGFALRALKVATEVGYPNTIQSAASSLSTIYANTDQHKKAYEMHVLFKRMADSVYRSDAQKKLSKRDAQHDFDKQLALTQAEHDKQIALAEEEKKKQTAIRNVFIGGFVVVLFLLVFIFRGYLNKKRDNRTIEEQRSQLEVKQKEIIDSINYARRIQTAQMASEKYISKQLKKLKEDPTEK